MNNKNYHHGDLKEAIINSAQRILKEQGADALSLRVIASDVGVSHMAPYAHFKNKKELFQAVAASGFNQLADSMTESSLNLTKAQDLILAYGATYVEFAIENPQLYRLMLGQVETGGRRNLKDKDTIDISLNGSLVSSELGAGSRRSFVLLQEAFSLVQTNDTQSKIKAQASGAWAMVHGMAALLIEGHIHIPKSLTVKEFLSMATLQAN